MELDDRNSEIEIEYLEAQTFVYWRSGGNLEICSICDTCLLSLSLFMVPSSIIFKLKSIFK